MTNAKRLEVLKQLKQEMQQPSFRTSIQKRRDCLSQIVPLLNFAAVYYENAMPIADILGRPGFTSNMYEQTFARMDYLVGQAITELEHDLAAQASNLAESKLKGTPTESNKAISLTKTKDEKAPSTFEEGLFLGIWKSRFRWWIIGAVMSAIVLFAVYTAQPDEVKIRILKYLGFYNSR